jgi:hypothetical protein
MRHYWQFLILSIFTCLHFPTVVADAILFVLLLNTFCQFSQGPLHRQKVLAWDLLPILGAKLLGGGGRLIQGLLQIAWQICDAAKVWLGAFGLMECRRHKAKGLEFPEFA